MANTDTSRLITAYLHLKNGRHRLVESAYDIHSPLMDSALHQVEVALKAVRQVGNFYGLDLDKEIA